MANARSRKPVSTGIGHDEGVKGPVGEAQGMPAAGLLSFLKEAGGRARTWTTKELATALRIGLPQAKEAMAVLQLQGYIEPAGDTSKWRVTDEGQLVSGAKLPRFTPDSVREALAGLRDRIEAVNHDPNAPYKIAEAVAFGDFLGDSARVQAAEVGIRLAPKSDTTATPSATAHAAEIKFLKQLRGKAALLHVVPYENWMSSRSHLRLL